MARDTQRQRIYDAEAVAFLGTTDKETEFDSPPCFKTLAEVQAYVDTVVASDLWRSMRPEVPHVEVRDGRGRRRGGASYEEHYIKLPKFARRRYYALHELAHVLSPNGDARAPHGPEYASTYLALVREFMSSTEAAQLLEAFKANRVKVSEVPDVIVESEVVEATPVLPDNIAEMINEEHRLARASYEDALRHAMSVGSMLSAKKEELPHGEFMSWVQANCDFDHSQATRYMKLHQGRPQLEANYAHAHNLSIRGALKVLEPPKPKPVPEAEPEVVPEPDIGSLSTAEKFAVFEQWDAVADLAPREAAESLITRLDGDEVDQEIRTCERLVDFYTTLAGELVARK